MMHSNMHGYKLIGSNNNIIQEYTISLIYKNNWGINDIFA